MSLPCVVYNATGPIEVRWYHSQNENPLADAEELNITAGGRYTVGQNRVLLTLGTQTALKVINFTGMN